MPNEFTQRFFQWMEANNVTRPQAAKLLKLDERSLSNYRSRGIPKRKQARATQIMQEHSKAAHAPEDNRISVTFNDDDWDLLEAAAGIVGSGRKEFIYKATVSRAKEEIRHAESIRSKVAEPTKQPSTNHPPLTEHPRDDEKDEGHEQKQAGK